jgi:hypothetical protein
VGACGAHGRPGSCSVHRSASCIGQNYGVGKWAMERGREEIHHWTSVMYALREAIRASSFSSAVSRLGEKHIRRRATKAGRDVRISINGAVNGVTSTHV